MWTILLVVAFACGLIAGGLLWSFYTSTRQRPGGESSTGTERYPVERTDELLGTQQHGLLKVLQREIGRDLYVFPRVRLGDVVDVSKQAPRRHFYMNLLRSKPVEFVLCDVQSARPVLAITYDGEDDQGEDMNVVFEILQAAGMPTLRLKRERGYAPSELKMLVHHAIKYRGSESAAAG